MGDQSNRSKYGHLRQSTGLLRSLKESRESSITPYGTSVSPEATYHQTPAILHKSHQRPCSTRPSPCSQSDFALVRNGKRCSSFFTVWLNRLRKVSRMSLKLITGILAFSTTLQPTPPVPACSGRRTRWPIPLQLLLQVPYSQTAVLGR